MIYFLIPVFNEEQNLELLYSNLTQTIPEYDKFYVFVDDGSQDGSVKLLNSLFKHTNFKVLGDGKNYGPGYEFNIGFEWILQHSQNENDKVVTMESDNTSDISILPQMIKIAELDFDMVLASPYAQGGGLEKTPFHRKFLSFMANIMVRNLLNIQSQSLSSFYRVFSIKLLKALKSKNTEIIKESGFICMLEVLVKTIRLNGKIIEVPMVLYSAKRKGKSKMKIINTSWKYLKFILKNTI